MDLYLATAEPVLTRPVMVLALSGWVDAASIATDAAELIADGGVEIGHFDPDELFDYRSSRPILHFKGGDLEDVVWPQLRVFHVVEDGVDLVVVHGNEPDFQWRRLTKAFVTLAGTLGIRRLVTLGAVPAAVPHTRPIEIVCTTSDATLLLDDDVILQEELIVPGAAVSVLRLAASNAGLDAIAYWARAPHYLTRPYYEGVLALLDRVGRQAGVHFDVADLKAQAAGQRDDLDRIARARPEIGEYIARLESQQELPAGGEELGPLGDLVSGGDLAAEVERYLREASGEEWRSASDDADEEREDGEDGSDGDHGPDRPGEAPDGADHVA